MVKPQVIQHETVAKRLVLKPNHLGRALLAPNLVTNSNELLKFLVFLATWLKVVPWPTISLLCEAKRYQATRRHFHILSSVSISGQTNMTLTGREWILVNSFSMRTHPIKVSLSTRLLPISSALTMGMCRSGLYS